MPAAPVTDVSGPISSVLAAIVVAAAAFLAWSQWRDLRTRLSDLPPREEGYFARQDLRRSLGTIVLLLLALGIGLGGRMPTQVDGHANLKFVQVWSGVILLILVLLILALLDWSSTRIYVRRQRQKLTDEGLSILEDELRIKMARRRVQLRDQGSNGSGIHLENE